MHDTSTIHAVSDIVYSPRIPQQDVACEALNDEFLTTANACFPALR